MHAVVYIYEDADTDDDTLIAGMAVQLRHLGLGDDNVVTIKRDERFNERGPLLVIDGGLLPPR